MDKNNKNRWRYRKKLISSIEDLPTEYKLLKDLHIIYKISFVNPENNEKLYYIGKKILFNKRKVKLSKKRKLELKTRKTFEYQIKESDWSNYYGSSTNKIFRDLRDKLGDDKFEREIIMFVEGKTKAAFYEAKILFSSEGMMHPKCLNLNILNKFFKNKLI